MNDFPRFQPPSVPLPPREVDPDEYDDNAEPDVCECCGGDGVVEYMDHPETWGEDCPSEENHLVPCPECIERERRAKRLAKETKPSTK